MSNDLARELSRQLALYANFVEEELDEVAEEVADEGRDTLERTSPERTGDYAENWAVKRLKNGEYVIHNKKRYQLTHLLEKGHLNRDGSRTPAQPHIKPVEKDAIKDFEKELIRRLQQ